MSSGDQTRDKNIHLVKLLDIYLVQISILYLIILWTLGIIGLRHNNLSHPSIRKTCWREPWQIKAIPLSINPDLCELRCLLLTTACLKLLRIILEIWNLVHKYTHISTFTKYIFQYQDCLNFADVTIFVAKIHYFLTKIVPILKGIV